MISAAAGGVGSIEAQLAKHRGGTVIGTDLLARVTRLAEKRAFTLLISGLYALDVASAYDDLDKLHSRGKVLLGTHLVNTRRIVKARDIHDAARWRWRGWLGGGARVRRRSCGCRAG